MRMFSHATGVVRRLEVLRPCIVQHEKRADLAIEVVTGKKIPHGKPVADHMPRAWPVQADQSLHRSRFCGHDGPPSFKSIHTPYDSTDPLSH